MSLVLLSHILFSSSYIMIRFFPLQTGKKRSFLICLKSERNKREKVGGFGCLLCFYDGPDFALYFWPEFFLFLFSSRFKEWTKTCKARLTGLLCPPIFRISVSQLPGGSERREMRLILLSLSLLSLAGVEGSCTFRSAKWTKVLLTHYYYTQPVEGE